MHLAVDGLAVLGGRGKSHRGGGLGDVVAEHEARFEDITCDGGEGLVCDGVVVA